MSEVIFTGNGAAQSDADFVPPYASALTKGDQESLVRIVMVFHISRPELTAVEQSLFLLVDASNRPS